MNVEKRQRIERQIVNRAIKSFLSHGLSVTLSYDDGDDPVVKSQKFSDFSPHIMAADEEWLIVYKGDEHIGNVYFVYGNDGYDVVCDYHVSLEPYMKDVNEYSEKLERIA